MKDQVSRAVPKKVEIVGSLSVESDLLDVCRHADDGCPIRLRSPRSNDKALADGIFTGPKRSRHGLVDDDVGLVQIAGVVSASAQGNAERAEIIGSDKMPLRHRKHVGTHERRARDHETLCVGALGGKRKLIGGCDGRHTWQGFEARFQPFVEDSKGLRVREPGWLEAQRQKIRSAKAGIDVQQTREAANQESCAHQQHQREGELDNDQGVASRARPVRVAAAAFLQAFTRIQARGA